MIFLAVASPTPGNFSKSAWLAALRSTFAAAAGLFAAWAATSLGVPAISPSASAATNIPPARTTLSFAITLSFWPSRLRWTVQRECHSLDASQAFAFTPFSTALTGWPLHDALDDHGGNPRQRRLGQRRRKHARERTG